MKTVQRKEVIKFYQIINHDEPVAVMSFRPPLIGVFTNQDALDSALKKKELNTVYTTTNTVKRESLKKLPRNKFATMTSNNSISANDIKEFRYFLLILMLLDYGKMMTESGMQQMKNMLKQKK